MPSRSGIAPLRVMCRIELSSMERASPAPIAPMMAKLVTTAERVNTMRARVTPTNEPHTTSRNFFIIVAKPLIYCYDC